MKTFETQSQTQDNLKLIGPLIFGHLIILMLIEHLFYPQPILTLTFFLIMAGDALLILALTHLSAVQRFLGKTMFPIIIGLLVIVPILATSVAPGSNPPPPQPGSGPEMETLRLIPLTFTALILVAWQYRMHHILFFCFVVTLTQSFFAAIKIAQSPQLEITPWLVVITIQFISFIIVGYFINLLVGQLKDQQKALAKANEQLIDYASTLEDLTISRERNAMARELHDTVAHTLSGLSVQLETTRVFMDVDLETAKSMLDRALNATRSGLQDTRRALQSLRATPLDDLGLIKALEEIAQSTAQRGNLQVELHLPHMNLHLPEAYEQGIYRITQEALNNILHHASAKKIQISLTRHHAEIHLMISDDGIGFDPEQQYAEHFGLVGMRERAALIGGIFEIQSEPGKGSQIHLTLRNSQ